jgi:hypothetical protein
MALSFYITVIIAISLILCLFFSAKETCDRGYNVDCILGFRHRYLVRRLQEEPNYYYTTTDKSVLGAMNPEAGIGNPLKGLTTSPVWTGPSTPVNLPTSLEFHYVGLNEVLIGDNVFDWSVLDKTLNDAASRYKHVIWRLYCHYPGRALAVPQYLLDRNIQIVDGSPNYNDETLLLAFEQFIIALGSRYDGHKSLAFIQMGLLGYWYVY